jgi:hypothetical protein
MPPAVSARRVKVQELRARTQALLLAVVAMVVMVAFMVLVVPTVFNYIVSRSQQKPTPASAANTAVKPQQPAVDSLPVATNVQDQTIKGFTSSGAATILVVDGQEVQQQKAADDGSFSFTIKLVEGEHVVSVVAANEKGDRSEPSPTQKVVVDVTVPTLTITGPADGTTYTLPRERVATITGQVSESATVFVNSNRVVTTGTDNTFSTTVQLGTGNNEIKISAQDTAGNTAPEQILKLQYSP